MLVGSSVSTSDLMITEALACAGLDLLWVDMEHTPLDRKEILGHIMAAQGMGIPIFVRVPWNDPVLVKPVLDMGPDGIIFPMISNEEEACRAAASMTYPPEGIRGYGPLRANRYGMEKSYLAQARKNMLCFAQIETKEGVDKIEEICACQGIDGILYGGMDLSASLGKLGETDTLEFAHAVWKVAGSVKKAGLLLGCCAPDQGPLVELYQKTGVDLYLASGDLAMLTAYAADMRKRLNKDAGIF